MLFISPAYAQSGAPDPITSFLFPLLLVLPIFYFLVIRPQQQRVKSHKEMVERVRRGDTVVLGNGFIGKVTKVKDGDNEVEVEFSETMKVRITRGSIAEVRGKGEPVKEGAA
ncbi:MAG: preprotein translocase subunit YajC [Hyphomicrobiaceae bacterium]